MQRDPASTHQPEPIGVTRQVELEADLTTVWDAVADPARRDLWLDDEDARSRVLRVDTVEEAQRLSWTWWVPGDEGNGSMVDILLVPLTDGRTRLTVTERLARARGGRTFARADMEAGAGASARWGTRLLGLELLLVAAGVVLA